MLRKRSGQCCPQHLALPMARALRRPSPRGLRCRCPGAACGRCAMMTRAAPQASRRVRESAIARVDAQESYMTLDSNSSRICQKQVRRHRATCAPPKYLWRGAPPHPSGRMFTLASWHAAGREAPGLRPPSKLGNNAASHAPRRCAPVKGRCAVPQHLMQRWSCRVE